MAHPHGLVRLAVVGVAVSWASLCIAQAATLTYNPGLGTLPDAQGWSKREGGPIQPAPTVSGGVLHQGPTDAGGHQYWDYTAVSYDFAASTVTVDLRLHIVSSSFNAYPRGGYTVFLSDNAGRLASLYLSSGSVFLGNDQFNSVSSISPFDTTDGFHDYRMTIGPTGSTLFIDGNSIVSLALGGVSIAGHTIAFGDGTTLAGSESNLSMFSVSGITVLNVPEPASMGVLAMGALAAAGLRRRRARR